MKTLRWDCVGGLYEMNFELRDGKLFDDLENEIPDELANKISRSMARFGRGMGEGFGIQVYFSSSGYSIPGRLCAMPGDCYPDDEEDKRIVERAILSVPNTEDIELPHDTAESLFDFYLEEIYEEVV